MSEFSKYNYEKAQLEETRLTKYRSTKKYKKHFAEVRKLLDQIYSDSCILPENFGEEICHEVTEHLIENNYVSTVDRKIVEEALMWCYICRMQ